MTAKNTKKYAEKNAAKKTPRKITGTYLHNSGLYYLQRFSSSTENFRRVMMRKIDKSCFVHKEQDRESCAQMLDELIAKFQRTELLDDNTYTTATVRSARQKGLSTRAIKHKLQTKGIPAHTVTLAIEQHDLDHGAPDGDLIAAARYVRRRRLGAFSTSKKENDGKKNMSTLARAGYSYEIAQKILQMNTTEIDDLITAGSG